MGMYDIFKNSLAHDLRYNLGNSDDHKCPDCGSSLEYVTHDDYGRELEIGDGYWKCTNCDFIMGEHEVYAADPGEYDPEVDGVRDNDVY